MALSLYDVCVPHTLVTLDSMIKIIDKALAHCTARKIEPAVLVNYRLAADMHPFARQLQIMTDQAKGMAARLTGAEPPSYPDTEATMEELKARLAKTKAFVEGVKKEKFSGAEDRQVTMKFGPNEAKFSGLEYVNKIFLPNFYFHATTAYDILRHAGVDIGKRDFLGM